MPALPRLGNRAVRLPPTVPQPHDAAEGVVHENVGRSAPGAVAGGDAPCPVGGPDDVTLPGLMVSAAAWSMRWVWMLTGGRRGRVLVDGVVEDDDVVGLRVDAGSVSVGARGWRGDVPDESWGQVGGVDGEGVDLGEVGSGE